MAESISEPYFKLNRSFLRLFLMWPNDYKKTTNRFIFFINMVVVLFIGCVTVGFDIYYLVFCKADELQKSRTFAVASYHAYCCIKYFHWILQMPKLTELILQLERSSFDFDELYQDPSSTERRHAEIRDVFRQKEQLRNETKEIINSARKTATGLFYSYVFCAFVFLFFIHGVIILARTVFFKVNFFGVGNTLPYETYSFFNINDSTQFILAVSFHYWHDIVGTAATIGNDLCLIGILIFSRAQTKIIGIILEKNTSVRNMPSELRYVQLRKCIHEINIVSDIIKQLNQSCSTVILWQYCIPVLFFCNVVYIIPKQEDAMRAAGAILFVIIFSSQLLLIAWFCQTFAEEFANLQYSIYNMNWLDAEPKFRRMLVFTMTRLQKPLSVNVGDFGPVNLSLYTLIMKTTYSFYTLISRTSSERVYKVPI